MAGVRKTEENPLSSVFRSLEKLLKAYAPPFKLTAGGVRGKHSVQLAVPKPVAIPGVYGGKPTELMMAAAIAQGKFVGFYFMPIYLNPELRKKLSPRLLKLLKGKTCFRVKKLDEGLKRDIEAALKLGKECYRERGWV
jgi:hypothetical protein